MHINEVVNVTCIGIARITLATPRTGIVSNVMITIIRNISMIKILVYLSNVNKTIEPTPKD
jgi:hypothetical protein